VSQVTFPKGAFYFVKGDDKHVKVNWDLPWIATRHMLRSADRSARNVRQTDDCKRGADEVRRILFLSQYGRYYIEWRRVYAAT